VHEILSSVFGLFFTPVGILVLAVLDSSMLFFLPAAIDTAVIVLSAGDEHFFWMYPLLASAGSVIGASVTYAVGRKIGETGLDRWISKKQMKKVRSRIDQQGVFAMGFTGLLPPPFPLTPFVLTSGALGLDARKFLVTLGLTRLVRFGTISALARLYGRRIIGWLESDVFQYALGSMMIVALIGTAISIVQVIRKAR
jgi:membrane protein YqaA with SNARE-associated domain